MLFSVLLLFACNVQEKTKTPDADSQSGSAGETATVQTATWLTPDQQKPGMDEQISLFVRRIFQDRRGHYWFGTNGDGVCRYDGDTLEYYPFDIGFGGVAIRAIAEDQTGDLWFGTSNGVMRYDGTDFTHYTQENGLSSYDVWCILADRDGNVWVGTWGGACRFNPATDRFDPFPLPPAKELDKQRGVTSLNIVHDIMEDRSGNLWFALGTAGVYQYDGESITNIAEAEGLCNASVNDILEDRLGNIWFATHHNGVCRFEGDSFTHFSEADGIRGNEVWSLFEDNAGHIWFPVEHAGVYRYDGKGLRNYDESTGLTSGAIQCIYQDREGRIWFGGHTGLFRMEGDSIIKVTKTGPWP